MDPLIWKHLPLELVRKIVLLSEPSIDTRVAFRIPPKKLDESKSWKLYYRLYSARAGLFYNQTTQSLHIFRIPGHHLVRRPVELDMMDEWITVLNQKEEDHILEIYQPDGNFLLMHTNATFITELPVILIA